MATQKATADAPADYVPTPAETPQLIFQGWTAARNGEPLDRAMPASWTSGWFLWHSTHSPHNLSRETH